MKNLHIISTFLVSMLAGQVLYGQCDITVSDVAPCANTPVSFQVDAPSGTYEWDFDNDGTMDLTGSIVGFSFPENNIDITYAVAVYENGNLCNTLNIEVQGVSDPTIGVLPGSGILEDSLIRVCSGSPQITLEIYNASTTYDDNTGYEINWGDGSVETFDNTTFPNTATITHDYNSYGYYDITVSVTSVNGCTNSRSYLLYNGSNPSVGLANPGNTVGLCVPATIEFPITNTTSNTTGTIYTVYVSGEVIETYTQDNVPNSFSYTFLEPSCGQTTSTGNYDNAFDVQVQASNPCGSSQATIEPIELSSPPDLVFVSNQPDTSCVSDEYTFTNVSNGLVEVIGGNCTDLSPSWSISPGVPGVHWEIISGNTFASEEIEVVFLIPGNYTITMTVNSPSCGEYSVSEQVEIIEASDATVAGELTTGASPATDDECLPTIGTFTNQSTGENLNFVWAIAPNSGWEYVDPYNSTSTDLQVLFTESGSYTVSLQAANECSADVWDTTLVIIGVPDVVLDPIPNACESAVLDFSSDNVEFLANFGSISSVQWSFPGGTPASSTDTYPQNISYTSPGNYTVEVTVTNQCGTNTVFQNFDIIPLGAISADPDTVVCETSAPIDLVGTPGGGTWTGNGVTGAIFTPSADNVGENLIVYAIEGATCVLLDSMVIEVVPVPAIALPNEQLLCINDAPYSLGAATPNGGTWTGNGISGNSFDPVAAGVGVHTVTYTFDDPVSGCANSETMNMEVVPLPEILVNDTVYCLTPGLVTLPYANPSGGNWSGTGVIGNFFDPVAAGGAGTYTVQYAYTDNNSCTQTEEVTIVLIAPDDVNAGTDFDLCINAGVMDLSQIAFPTGGTWNANGSLGLDGSLFDPELAGVGTHTLTYIIGSGNCQVTDEVTVSVYPIPVVAAMGDMTVCVSENIVPLTGTPFGGTWTATNGGVLIGNVFDASASGVGAFSFVYTYEDVNGCEYTDEVVISVNGLPNITTTDTSFCDAPGIVVLPAAQPSGGTWSGPGVVGNAFDPQLVSGPGTYQLAYSFTDTNGCTNSESANITLLPAPAIEAGATDTLCIDQGLYVLSGYSPVGGEWSGPGLTDTQNGLFDPMLAGLGLHEIQYSVGVGNCMVTDTRSLLVVDLEVEAGESTASCSIDGPVELEGYTPEGGVWSGVGITDPVNGIFDPVVAGPGSYVLTYTYTDPYSGCVASDSMEMNNYPMEPAAFNMPDFACKDELIFFENLSPSDYEVFWSFGIGAGTSTEFSPEYAYDAVGTYTVTLIVTNPYGCMDTISHEITIADVPFAQFVPSIDETCADVGVDFSNLSFGDSLSYYWEFGDFMTSTEENPGTIFFEPGFYDTTYLVSLTVTNPCGSATYQDIIVIHPVLNADFGLIPLTACSPLFVDFANASTGTALEYFWDFGNGNTSNEQFPDTEAFFTGTTPTTYTVTLITTNLCGADTSTANLLVEPANVIAAAGSSISSGCAPLTVDFYNYSSPIAVIDWDFGDGNTSSEEEPTHTFTEPGEFIVTQYAHSDCGYDTATIVITVYPQPYVHFEHNETNCMGQEIQFVNNSVGVSGNYWDFGDGDTSTLNNPVHVYDSPGTYTITLVGVSFGEQCENEYISTITINDTPAPDFDPSTTYGCAPLEVSFENTSSNALFYEWDFGDGNTSIQTSPTHTFEEAGTYQVTLLATDVNGCFEETAIYNVIVEPVPTAHFEYEKEAACGLPATIEFINLSQGALEYEWKLEDIVFSTLTNPSLTFTEAGTYQVHLEAFNQFACTDTYTLDIEIFELPVAAIDLEGLEDCGSLEVAFNNTSSFAMDYQWDFGDGHSSTVADPVHEYTVPGSYDVQLIASINGDCHDTLQLSEVITVHPEPVANFEAVPTSNDGTYDITNLSENADSYYWEFSDGATSTVEHPTHRFLSNAIQQIYLEASNQYGCVDDTLVSFTPDFVKGLFLPNAFSPEQGIGDVRLFKPKGIGLKEYRLQIYSTYGLLLWESTELDEEGRPAEGWDGIVDGKLMPQDVYVWKCKGIFRDGTTWQGVEKENGEYKMMGSLVLLR